METNKPVANLNEWEIGQDGCLTGVVTGHHVYADGHAIRTTLARIDLEAGTAETPNTMFILGRPLSDVTKEELPKDDDGGSAA